MDALRAQLVHRLRAHGDVRTEAVASAFGRVPRHAFVPGVPADEAYADRSIAIKLENGVPISSSSQPAIMAVMLELLDVREGDRVLEIGTGSGYNAALLAELTGPRGRVVTIDLDAELAADARARFAAHGYEHVHVICGDGALGEPDASPYDAVISTVGVERIPAAWIAQLHDGARLVAPLTVRALQKVVAFERTATGLQSRAVVDAAFMMLRGPSASSDTVTLAAGDPDVALRVFAQRANDIAADAVAAALRAAHRDARPARRLSPPEVWNGATLWLALRDDAFCTLTAYGASAERGIVPNIGREPVGVYGFATTMGLCDAATLAVFAPAGPRDAGLRAFGEGRATLERLQAAIVAWDDARRPGNAQLEIAVSTDGATRVRLHA